MSRWIIAGITTLLLTAVGTADLAYGQQYSAAAEQKAALPSLSRSALQPGRVPPVREPAEREAMQHVEEQEECCEAGPDSYGDGTTCNDCPCFYCQAGKCSMLPHYPYFPPMNGYYYFRPYNFLHVIDQQLAVDTWGGDPRNPYANSIFKRIYAEYKAQRAKPPER